MALQTDQASADSSRHSPFGATDAGRLRMTDVAHMTQLNIVLQLLRASDRLLVVQGPTGVGKSEFLRSLLLRQPERLRLSMLVGSPELELGDLLAGFGSDSARRADPADWLQDCAHRGERPVLLIDNADKLNGHTFGQLISLWNNARAIGLPFGLILAACTGLPARVQANAPAAADAIHAIQLRGFSEKQTVEYLTQRLDAAGISSMDLLSDAEMRLIHTRTNGVPALVDAEMRRVLSERLTGGADPKATALPSGRRLTRWVAACVLLLAAVLIAALSYTERQRLSRPALAQPIDGPALVNAEPVERAAPAAEQLAPADFAVPPPTQPDDLAHTEAEPASPEVAVQAAAPTTDPASAAIEPAVEPATQAVVATEQSAPAATTPPPAVSSPPTAAEPATTPPAATAAPAATGVAPAKPEQATPTAAPRVDNAWLSARKPDRYTIQLIAARDGAALVDYVGAHGIEGRAKLLEVVRNGGTWYVVVLGDYGNWSAAGKALDQLPAQLRRDGAWVRRFDELQAQTRR